MATFAGGSRSDSAGSATEARFAIRTFDLARTLQQADEADFADLARLLAATAEISARGVRPTSQMLQEAFALGWSRPDRKTFVECGAAGPTYLSNTYVLQSHFGWTGVLVEPNPDFVGALAQRVSPSVFVEPLAVGRPGEIELVCAGELSSSTDVMLADGHARERQVARAEGRVVRVPRVPLQEVLERSFAEETTVGFLSVDVEGGELDALDSLDWDVWSFHAITVEHNNVEATVRALDDAMERRGYRRVLRTMTDWDAWYVPINDRERR